MAVIRRQADGWAGTAAAGVKYIEWGSPAAGDLAGTYPNPTIAANAVSGAKVADNSLTGADIDESTLTQVPSAGFATNAISAFNATTRRTPGTRCS